MVLIMNKLGEIDDIRYGSGFILNRGFLIMIGHKISVIADGKGGAP